MAKSCFCCELGKHDANVWLTRLTSMPIHTNLATHVNNTHTYIDTKRTTIVKDGDSWMEGLVKSERDRKME